MSLMIKQWIFRGIMKLLRNNYESQIMEGKFDKALSRKLDALSVLLDE